jgi:predicted RNA binding protein YcfA (HicA-like mRNA interferase family)
VNARLPTLTGREVVRALQAAGFSVIRIKGSHHFLRHDRDPTSCRFTATKSWGRPLLRKILKDAGLTVDGLIALL